MSFLYQTKKKSHNLALLIWLKFWEIDSEMTNSGIQKFRWPLFTHSIHRNRAQDTTDRTFGILVRILLLLYLHMHALPLRIWTDNRAWTGIRNPVDASGVFDQFQSRMQSLDERCVSSRKETSNRLKAVTIDYWQRNKYITKQSTSRTRDCTKTTIERRRPRDGMSKIESAPLTKAGLFGYPMYELLQ